MLNLVISLKKNKKFFKKDRNGLQKFFKKNFSKRQPDPFVRCIRGVVHPYTDTQISQILSLFFVISEKKRTFVFRYNGCIRIGIIIKIFAL